MNRVVWPALFIVTLFGGALGFGAGYAAGMLRTQLRCEPVVVVDSGATLRVSFDWERQVCR